MPARPREWKDVAMKTRSQPFTEDTLREAREKLLARDATLTERLEQVRADLRREPATGREKDEVLHAIEESARAEISRIEAALERTEEGTLGLCEECGREIEASRFIAAPYATHCKDCARDG